VVEYQGLRMVLTLTAAWFAAERFVLRPVASLIEATRKLAAGDQGARTSLPDGQSELCELARSFDEMASALESRQGERDRAEEALRRSESSSGVHGQQPGDRLRSIAGGEVIMPMSRSSVHSASGRAVAG
jgi:HAMP domain-containing protein